MASDRLGAEETRERPRWTENCKVYTRKFRNKNKISDAQKSVTVTPVNDAVNGDDVAVAATAAANNNLSEKETDPGDGLVEKDIGNAVSVPEDAGCDRGEPNSPIIEVISGDSLSGLNARGGGVVNGDVGIESASPVMPVAMRIGEDRVRISLSAASTKHERRELKRKLVSELEEVKRVAIRLQDKVDLISGYGDELGMIDGFGGQRQSGYVMNDGFGRDGGGMRVFSEVGSVGFNDSRRFQHLSVSVMDDTRRVVEVVEKEKRTPKANQYYRSSEFLFGTERLPPSESNKKVKGRGGRKRGGGSANRDKQIYRKCGSLLTKLMKHQFGFIFNTPVDVKTMGLHDYYDIIKHPMDLGTVKKRLGKNWYKSPLEFAEDVRLTFRNARIYNPEGQDVHVLAVELSNNFEERWVEIEAEYSSRLRYEAGYDMGLPNPTSRRAPLPTYVSPPPPIAPALSLPPPPVYVETRHLARSESFPLPVESRQKPVYNPPVGRAPSLKKPKAKDLNKRDMTFDEKQKLSDHLQALPSERLDSFVQIMKKRNSTLSQHDDEIEVDINCVDTETLWELDRFVTNYKKSLSKHKRRAELARQRAEEQQQAMQVMNPGPPTAEVPQQTRDDDTNAVAQPSPSNVRKDAANVSSSSSSSSSSSDSGSSSSDSDSDSSSDS